MELETAGAETPAAEGAQPEATDANSESSTEQQSEAESKGEASATEETGDTSGDDAAAPPKRKHWAHERIDEITRQKHDAIRDRDYWKQKAQELSAKDINSLEYDDQLVVKVQTASVQDRIEEAERSVQRATAQQFEHAENEARAKWADYDVVTRNQALPFTESFLSVVTESEQAADILYHLGKNPNEAWRLVNLSERNLARELGKLEAKLSAPKPTPKLAPDPVKPVTGINAGGSKDPAKMSMAEYIAWREANP
jgi:hypothetical protein